MYFATETPMSKLHNVPTHKILITSYTVHTNTQTVYGGLLYFLENVSVIHIDHHQTEKKTQLQKEKCYRLGLLYTINPLKIEKILFPKWEKRKMSIKSIIFFPSNLY